MQPHLTLPELTSAYVHIHTHTQTEVCFLSAQHTRFSFILLHTQAQKLKHMHSLSSLYMHAQAEA